ncbi:nucleotidyltransferase domain-containing protein [uncultured Thiodictyon sp.]|uniref:nucleotidyltransferase domain-containing protein n=1 Tax=uncultured Thiodictyon sp. TaxID=1846217 RepID=UPI0025E62118|nr:nucleotidyltransferase domain-containing protein [uncultured Thiodictyon sp.]
MRLTEEQRKMIREAGLRHFGVAPQVFGSRLNDAARGGDIDLFIPGDWPPQEAVPRRLRLCAELHRCLGDQKIDVVVEALIVIPATWARRMRSQAILA